MEAKEIMRKDQIAMVSSVIKWVQKDNKRVPVQAHVKDKKLNIVGIEQVFRMDCNCEDIILNIDKFHNGLIVPLEFDPDNLIEFKHAETGKVFPDLAEKFKRAARHVGGDDDARIVLRGVYFDAKNKAIAASNGKSLFYSDMDFDFSAVVRVSEFLTSKYFRGPVSFGLGENNMITFAGEGWVYTLKTIEGNFPNWPCVIPETDNHTKKLVIGGKEDIAKIKKHKDYLRLKPGDNRIEVYFSTNELQFYLNGSIDCELGLSAEFYFTEGYQHPVIGEKDGGKICLMPIRK